MGSTDNLIHRIETECEIPDGWNVFETGPEGAIEISELGGEGIEEAIVELIDGDLVKEVVLAHVKMPGMASAQTKGGLEALDEPALEVPSQMGVLQFENRKNAIEAVDQLTDPDVLEEIAKLRSPLETDDPLSVREAVAEATDIDMSTVKDTLTAI